MRKETSYFYTLFTKWFTQLYSDLGTKAEVLLQSFPFSIAIPAQGYAFVDITITMPEGYYLGAFTVFGGESRNAVSLGAVLIADTVIAVEGRNAFTSELTVPGNVNVLFCRKSKTSEKTG